MCWHHYMDAHIFPCKNVDRRPFLLSKPLMHLHTQYNRDIPWGTIDMDFMNSNQSAHGDREYGYINSRMGLSRKVIAGYWDDEEVKKKCPSGWIRRLH